MYLFKMLIIYMVRSEKIIVNNIGKKVIHSCSICKTAFLNFEKAENCELSHNSFKNPQNKNDYFSKARNEKSSCESSISNMIKYHVLVREAYRLKTHEFYLEAPNIQEVADMVRDRYPHHSGYTIKKEE